MTVMARNSQYTFLVLMIFSVFGKVHGLAFVTKPNNTIEAFTGFNQTFTWTLNLTEEDKSKELKVQFGPWNKHYSFVKYYLMTFVRKPSGKESEAKTNHSTAKRLYWTGDLSRDNYIAFQLVNIKRDDSGDYGIRFRVDYNLPGILDGCFTLSVQDPPVKPTVDSRHIKMEIEEGKHLNITCRSSTEASSAVIWMRDRRPGYTGQSKFLFIASVNRSQAGNYVCLSKNPTGNSTSAITTVNVVYAPSIHSSSKLVSGNSVTLMCEADGNPSPTFDWQKGSERIREGFNSTWNSSTLMVTPTNDEDFTRYVCTARNRFGWDALTFLLHEKGPQAVANTKPADTEEDSLIKYVSVSAVLAIVLVCAFLTQRYVAKRYKIRRQNDPPDETHTHSLEMATVEPNQLEAIYSELNPSFSGDIEWEIPRANLNVEKVIGRGAFGVVSRGSALDLPGRPGWTVAAVKSIQEDASERERGDLLSEMSVLKHLDPHPHVIRLYGCVSTEARPLVVVEYAEYGDVLGYLRKSRGVRDNYYSDPSIKPRTSLTSKQLLKFAWEISDGMEYLSTKKIIHRDLAARNVLVGEGEVCKITDFGMARDVQEEDIYVRTHEGRLPIKWTAPEALFGSGAYTTASDVWSYGVVLYEIFTVGGDPFPGVYMRDIPALLKNGYRMSRPKFISPKLYDIMMECWKNDPSYRPSFGCLRSTLQKLMEEEEQEYVNLEELFYENVLPTSCQNILNDH